VTGENESGKKNEGWKGEDEGRGMEERMRKRERK